MALTPEQIAEIQRLKALMQQPAADAQRKAQATWNAEQIANRQGKSDGGGVSPYDAFGFGRRERSLGEKFQDNVMPHVERGLESIFPLRRIGKMATVAAGTQLGKMREENPALFDKTMQNNQNEANRGFGYAQSGARKALGMKPIWQDSEKMEYGPLNEGEFGKAKGGQISQDAMQLALMAKGGAPKKTVTAYKMFRADPKQPGKLFPLFVDADTPVPMGEWVDAIEGAMSKGKVKSKIGPLAYRPGWHAGDLPLATHIGDKDAEQKAEVARIQALRQEMLTDIGEDKEGKKIVKKMYPYPKWVNAPRLRNPRHIWAEIEMPHDVDWQTEAEKRGYNDQGKFVANRAHITDQLPAGGHYRYKTNANMTGNWLIGGAMKVNKILNDAEVAEINARADTADLPRLKPLKKEVFGFAHGGVTHAHHLDIEERPL